MSISTAKRACATSVRFAKDMMCVHLADGREISVPLVWFPRLSSATAAQRARWRLIGKGNGIHWSDLDEDVSVAALLDR